MKPELRAVPTELPDPPYPSTTKLNGYEPRIDWQRIRASKTWRLCPADQRNHLLRLWLESWNEYPCGSWEDDDELIAAAIDVPVRVFLAHKDILMRGWRRHSDGRFYHPFIAEKVLQMVGSRKSTAKRVAEWRNKKNQQLAHDVTRYQHVSNATEKEKEKEKEKDLESIGRVGKGGVGGKEKTASPAAAQRSLPRKKNCTVRMKQPTVEELTAYARDAGIELDAQTMHDWYSSNGWRVGKNPMKDWMAAARGWARRQSEWGQNGNGQRKTFAQLDLERQERESKEWANRIMAVGERIIDGERKLED